MPEIHAALGRRQSVDSYPEQAADERNRGDRCLASNVSNSNRPQYHRLVDSDARKEDPDVAHGALRSSGMG